MIKVEVFSLVLEIEGDAVVESPADAIRSHKPQAYDNDTNE